MKKLILLLGVILLNASCDPVQDAWEWNVKNCTGQTLKLKYPYYSYSIYTEEYTMEYWTVMIAPGNSVNIYGTGYNTKPKRSLYFNHYFKEYAGIYGEDVYWQILSESDVILKTWSYSDRGLPDQRFFDESSWYYSQYQGNSAFLDILSSWVFEILPEDISSEQPEP